MAASTDTVFKVPFIIGMVICQSCFRPLAPSNMAASLTSSGTAIIFPRIIRVVVPVKKM